jgi:hypothetical protein
MDRGVAASHPTLAHAIRAQGDALVRYGGLKREGVGKFSKVSI